MGEAGPAQGGRNSTGQSSQQAQHRDVSRRAGAQVRRPEYLLISFKYDTILIERVFSLTESAIIDLKLRFIKWDRCGFAK